jgi:uncharacterized protein
MITRVPGATVVGLFVALLGPYILLAAKRALGTDFSAFWQNVAIWSIFVATISIVLFREHRPISSIGLRPLRLQSLGIGVVAGFLISLVFPTMQLLLQKFGLEGYEKGLALFYTLPLWRRVFAVITAGVVEETLYRGYGIERVTELTRNRWLGALIPLVLFTLAHSFAWAPSHMITVAVAGALFTMLYLWQRDILLCIVAHTTSNAIGFVIVPLFAKAT